MRVALRCWRFWTFLGCLIDTSPQGHIRSRTVPVQWHLEVPIFSKRDWELGSNEQGVTLLSIHRKPQHPDCLKSGSKQLPNLCIRRKSEKMVHLWTSWIWRRPRNWDLWGNMGNMGHHFEPFGPRMITVRVVFPLSAQSQTCSQMLSNPAKVAPVSDPVCGK